MPQNFMEALFGVKRKKRTSRKSSAVSKGGKKKKGIKPSGVKPPASLRKSAKKHGVRITTGKVPNRKYRKVSEIKKEIKVAKAKLMKKTSPKKRRTSKKRSSSSKSKFGQYTLDTAMAPYPYAVDASPPWI